MPAATTVLCGIDFSKHSARALRYAAAMAQRLKGGLVVAFVNDPLLAAASAVQFDSKVLAAQTNRQMTRFVANAIGTRVGVERVVATGDPGTELLRIAGERRCGFIAVGTQGLRGARHLLFGSTTEQLLRHATVPVLAIPPGAPRAPSRNWPRPAIACAVDLDTHLRDDAVAAAELAATFGAKLVLLHVVKAPVAPPWLAKQQRRAAAGELTAAALSELSSAAAALGTVPAPEYRVLTGNPAETISSFAKRHVQMVILRLRRGPGWFGSRPGTITYQMLAVSAVPVLALPADDEQTS